MNFHLLDQFKYWILILEVNWPMVIWCLTSPPLLWGWCPRPCSRLTNPPFPVSSLLISTLTHQIFSFTDLSWDYKFRVNSERDIFIKPRSFVVARHEHCRFSYLKSRFTAIFGGLQQWQQWGQGALSHLWNSFDTFNCTHWPFRNRDAVLLCLFPVSRFRFAYPAFPSGFALEFLGNHFVYQD